MIYGSAREIFVSNSSHFEKSSLEGKRGNGSGTAVRREAGSWKNLVKMYFHGADERSCSLAVPPSFTTRLESSRPARESLTVKRTAAES